MAHQHDFRHIGTGLQTLVSGLVIVGVQANAVHATVQFQPHMDGFGESGLLDGIKLPQRMHHTPKVMFDDQWQFIRFKKTFQQQDWRANTGGAQFQCFFNTGHGKTVSLGLKSLGAAHGTVAVGIGLDHSKGLGPRDFTGQLVIVTQGLEVDQGTGWAHGGGLLTAKE